MEFGVHSAPWAPTIHWGSKSSKFEVNFKPLKSFCYCCFVLKEFSSRHFIWLKWHHLMERGQMLQSFCCLMNILVGLIYSWRMSLCVSWTLYTTLGHLKLETPRNGLELLLRIYWKTFTPSSVHLTSPLKLGETVISTIQWNSVYLTWNFFVMKLFNFRQTINCEYSYMHLSKMIKCLWNNTE